MVTVTKLWSMLVTIGVAAAVAGCGSTSAPTTSSAALGDTIWCSEQEHSRVAVDRRGTVEVKEGKDVCISFTANSGLYVAKVVWWNVGSGIHVEEWAVVIPVTETLLQYAEADHMGNEDFTGIFGTGDITIDSDSRMTMSQLGNLMDGTAAGFTTTLTQVDQMPDIPLPVTYPSD